MKKFFVITIMIIVALLVILDRTTRNAGEGLESSETEPAGVIQIPNDPADEPELAESEQPETVHTPAPTDEPELVEPEQPEFTFTPLAPIYESALADAITWAQAEFYRIFNVLNEANVEPDFEGRRHLFNSANAHYRAGRLSDAERGYASILANTPTHLGARNNYVLALFYQSKYEEALRNAILLAMLHPSHDATWVNIQLPLYALGYHAAVYTPILDSLFGDYGLIGNLNLEQSLRNEQLRDYIAQAYAYNRSYADMEVEIGMASMDFDQIEQVLLALVEQNPDDEDFAELLEYFRVLRELRTN